MPAQQTPVRHHEKHPTIILSLILISYMMIVIDNSVVITGLPKIHQELSFSLAGLSWISSAYALTFGGLLLLSAKAGDIFGRKRMLNIGLTIFTLASLAISLAPDAVFLVIARAIQGAGAAILAPSTLAILQITFPAGPARTRAISLYAAAGGLSASVGLVIGGVLAELVSWRAGFMVNVPIGIVLIFAASRYIDETDKQSGKPDIPGAILSSLGMTGIVYGTVSSGTLGWGALVTQLSFLVGGLLLVWFILIERKVDEPIMPLHLFHNAERSGAYAARLLYIGAAMGFFFYSTQFMQGVLHFYPIQAGLAFLPAMMTNFVVALNVPKLVQRMGSRRILILSLLFALIGMLMLSRLDASSTFISGLLLPTIFIGIGIGGAMGPLTTSGINGVAPKDAGAASGIVNVAHQIGGALGLSVLVAAAEAGGENLAKVPLLIHQTGNAFTAGAVLITLSLLLVLTVMGRTKKPD
ncbi:MFS transporter [Pantoea sp.]|uniref:MFS transporter n=1 Tax=Pantoea sp. TaxID=69393 RepID=UPI0028AC504E|nr:MFS transporter [Pantoea sp.]